MVLYDCKLCNYSTKLLGNYKQHEKTNKHGRNIHKHNEKKGSEGKKG